MTMGLILKILIYLYLCSGFQCMNQTSWLACQFIDHYLFIGHENHTETKFFPRDAMLQFGQAGDTPINPHAITFLVTRSKVDLRKYIEGAAADQLQCELRWYSTEGIQLRWPSHGAQEYDRWFTCSLKHTEGLFAVTSFLRHTPAMPPSAQEDYRTKPAVGDRDTITTSVAMVLQTRTPSVRARLLSNQALHCQFAVDHRGPKFNMEWLWYRHGDRVKPLLLFSHASRSGQTQGKGVKVKDLVGGDASLSLSRVNISSEIRMGTYVCSMSVPPLSTSHDIALHIVEPPRVSLNVDTDLSLPEGGEQKLVCTAEGYYPLDVEIEWHRYQEAPGASNKRVGAPLPEILSSHKHNLDKTFSLSAFHYLQASLRDSGSQFVCSVSHSSLRMPIRKSITLTVQASWFNMVTGVFILVTLLIILRVRQVRAYVCACVHVRACVWVCVCVCVCVCVLSRGKPY